MAGKASATATVTVLSSAADRAVADSVRSGLRDKGLPVVDDGMAVPAGGRVVVLISPAAVRDPHWLAAVAAVAPQRLVPVPVGAGNDVEGPDRPRPLNWILWLEDGPRGPERSNF